MKREPLFNADLGKVEDVEPIPQCIGTVEHVDLAVMFLREIEVCWPVIGRSFDGKPFRLSYDNVGDAVGIFVTGTPDHESMARQWLCMFNARKEL